MIYRPPEPQSLWGLWVIKWKDEFHIFYDEDINADYDLLSWQKNHDHVGHAVSRDLVHWETRPSFCVRGEPGDWNEMASGGMKTGCVIQHEDKFYMYVGAAIKGVQVIGLWISDDLEDWKQHPDNPVLKPGVFLLEVQEPTDWVIQPERYLGDIELSHQDMWGNLSVEDGLKCFDYKSKGSVEQIVNRCRLSQKTIVQNSNYIFKEIIGPSITDCFAVYKLEVNNSCNIELNRWALAIVTEGNIRIENIEVKQGEYFFIPYMAKMLSFEVESNASIYLIGNQPLKIG